MRWLSEFRSNVVLIVLFLGTSQAQDNKEASLHRSIKEQQVKFRTTVLDCLFKTSELRLQFVLDTVTGAFTATIVNTITSSDFFNLGSLNLILGKVQKYRTTNLGYVNMLGPPAAHFAGLQLTI